MSGKRKKWIRGLLLGYVAALALLAIDIFSLNISTIYLVVFGMLIGIAAYFRPKKKTETAAESADNGVIVGDIEQNELQNDKSEGEENV